MPFTVSSDGLPSVALRRVEPERNVARFYELALARDLFGQVVLVREWGRIGTFGRRRQDEYASEMKALAALLALAAQKRRRGYSSDPPAGQSKT
jgi:predicted DNA-binding WGR domain protein